MGFLKNINVKRFEGKVAIITGAGSQGQGIGNGRAIAILLAKEGAKVVIVDENAYSAQATADMISVELGETSGNNTSSLVVCGDITNQEDCKRVVKEAVKTFGKIDILVNNVGIIGPKGTAVEVDADDWDRAMQINVKSIMLMSKYCVPEFEKANNGSIINVGSTAGLRGGHPNLLYPTSKGALVNMTKSMAVHHGFEGIRVNAVAPGMVYTPMVAGDGRELELREERRRQSLLQTEGTAWDIAKAVVFLASEDARWITGVILPVDAGLTAGQPRKVKV